MDSSRETGDARMGLALEYARFCRARTALGSAWAGLIALWPLLWLSSVPALPKGTQSWPNLLALGAPLLWVVGRELLGRALYQPLGKVRMRPEVAETAWNRLVMGLLIGVGLLETGMLWHLLTRAGLPPMSGSRIPMLLLQAGWLIQVVWVGLRHVAGWEERLVFLWLGLLGGMHLTVLPGLAGLAFGGFLAAGTLASLLLAPFLLVRGVREHRRFRSLVAEIQALPSVGA